MKIHLKNKDNGKNYDKGDKRYNLILIQRDNEIIITTEDGIEIATLDASVIWGENCDASDNFFLNFNVCKSKYVECIDRHMAEVYVERIRDEEKVSQNI